MDEEQADLIFESKAGRYLSLHGSYIDQLGLEPHEYITEELVHNRELRDKDGHHITVVNHLDIVRLTPTPTEQLSVSATKKQHKKTLHCTIATINEKFGSVTTWTKPIDLGMGTTQDADAVTFFRVLHWPFGQNIQSHLGLEPHHFHITVGFKPRDVHLYKGPATLLCLQEGYSCTKEQIHTLVGYASWYFEDKEFIKRLFQTCWRHGYYTEVIRLTQFCIASFILHWYHKIFKKKQYPATSSSSPPEETTPLINAEVDI